MKKQSFLTKSIFGFLLLSLFICWSQTLAADCSNTNRGIATVNVETYSAMYGSQSWVRTAYIEKAFTPTVWATTAYGNKNRHDNKRWLCNNGGFAPGELSQRDAFWTADRLKVAGASNGPILTNTDVAKMQQYINDYCGLWLTVDGSLGKRTVNAVQICLPPNEGKIKWSEYTNLAPDACVDTECKIPLITGAKLDAWFDPKTKAYINPNNTKQIIPESKWFLPTSNASCSEFASSDSKPLDTSEEKDLVQNSEEGKNENCGCKPWYKKETVAFEWKPGEESQSLAVCRKCDPVKCNCGVKLNTNVPFIWRCIVYGMTNDPNDSSYTNGNDDIVVVNPLNAFPVLMTWIVKILMTLILLICFGALIVAGVMMTIPEQYDTGKWLIKKVVVAIALLWLSGTILYLINPNFFF